jgi:Saxitoxin biosynthesis operon protein SxtJ
VAGQSGSHETFAREEIVAGPSNVSFGRTFAIIFALLGLVAAWRDWRIGPEWFFAPALAFAAATLVRPSLLAPLNRAWLRFGLLLHQVVNPLIMGAIFFLVFTPMGLVMRAFGKDFLRLKRDPKAASYWILRQPPGPAPDSLKNQF